jgi:hypothetical protein
MSGGDFPAVEGPETRAGTEPPADKAQPGDASMSRIGHVTLLSIEVENGLRRACSFFGSTEQGFATSSNSADAVSIMKDVSYPGAILVGRPVAMEIVKEGWPVRLQVMRLEVAEWEREPVVDADERGGILRQRLHQPFSDALARPICAWRWRWRDFDRRCITSAEYTRRPFRLAVGVRAPE